MSNGNDGGEGILRRVVRTIAGPARELIQRAEDSRLSQFADSDRAELKAMIERKRRNDFVRKRELDMLRRIRREGLTPEQAAALANSNLDDVDGRSSRPSALAEGTVKAKIDAIEKQMVGIAPPSSRPLSLPPVPAAVSSRPARLRVPPPVLTQSLDSGATVPLDLRPDAPAATKAPPAAVVVEPAAAPAVPAAPLPAPAPVPAPPAARELPPLAFDLEPFTPAPAPGPAPSVPKASAAAVPTAPAPAASPAVRPAAARLPAADLPEVEVLEIQHDPELDEAVIAFANADFTHSERVLVQMTGAGGPRQHHEDTWLVLFDLYRATGQQQRFEALSLAFAEQCGRSPPQWYSLPRLLSDATAPQRAAGADNGQVGWVCPARLDSDGLSLLASQLLQLPQPWVLDWTQLKRIEPDAAAALRDQFQRWASEKLAMRWLAADKLFEVLQEAAPVGVRDADPAFWLARLDALRLVNRPDQFDDVAIDYCVTYEVSPPSWEATRCTVRVSGPSANTRSAILSSVGDAVTSLMDDGHGEVEVTTLEISGQLAGDQGPLIRHLDQRLGDSKVLRISCALLIRVDFVAAGDLLNWVIAKRAEGRQITFFDVNRLVALMFGAMGINEHVSTQLRQS
ncbi:STAS domain-containing protein [Ideonella sp.]|uniref:STAS domain-containing protein n=1 Tax=Ideonella sp. TaxID=1929293 RepID=UPI002B478A81|nr:STAS domain-containing protein [Ideonella sp.]HJV69835.1 STAS domain-containing protein [Ideonella sp.]